MENLTIDQLVDLKIAIKKETIALKINTDNNNFLTNKNTQLTANNVELEKELTLQETRINEAIAENEKLRLEKEGVLSKFATDNEKVYNDLREKEQKIANEAQQTSLRAIELEKREHNLINKEGTNKAILDEAKLIKKQSREESKQAEVVVLGLDTKRKQLEKEADAIVDKKVALKQMEFDINAKKIELNEKDADILKNIQINSNLVAELQSLKITSDISKEKTNRLILVYKELQKYVIETGLKGSDITIKDIETRIQIALGNNKDMESSEDIKIEDIEIEEEDIKIEDMDYVSLKKLAEFKKIEFKGNIKKEDLIILLNK